MNGKFIDILLVEDNDDDVVMLTEAMVDSPRLRLRGSVDNGDKALLYLRERVADDDELPDLVFLDINMPGKNGFEVLGEIKCDQQLRHLPVIMLTSSSRSEDILQSYTAGACSYVQKPSDFQSFIDTLQDLEAYWAGVSTVPRISS